ncbi:MAG TPA: AI-2E family transporter, partial [Roseiflexaceae bacterium]|nr:AI-2E family transporter [Roseiflexaceae bacterium]
RPTLALFGGSLALSAALRPLVMKLETRGMSRSMAILVWYVLILAGLAIGGFIYGAGLLDEVSVAAERLPRFYEETVAAWQNGGELQQMLARGLPDFMTLLQSMSDAGGLALAGGAAMALASGLIGNLIFVIAVLSLAYYWLIEATHFERLWLSLLPVNTRVRARDIWRNTESAVGAYIRSTVVAVTVSGLLLLVVFTFAGLPFRSLLALVGAFAHIVPSLGPALGLLPAILVGLATSPLEGLIVLVGGGIVQIIAREIARRMLKAQAVKVNPLLQVLLILALADVAGFASIVFGPPLAAMLQVLYANILASSSTQVRESALDPLFERLKRVREQTTPDSRELSSILRRSDDLMRQASDILDNGQSTQGAA